MDRASLLLASDQCLKVVVPAKFKPGVFACRITADGVTSNTFLLNTPDAWWLQGDEGEAATPGGWLRVLGKSLSADTPDDKAAEKSADHCVVRLEAADGAPIMLRSTTADSYSAKFDLPTSLPVGRYTVRVHNGFGGELAWRTAGTLKVIAAPAIPTNVYSVLDTYGPDAVRQMRGTLVKYMQPLDRTAGVQAALEEGQGAWRRRGVLSRRPICRQRPN